MKKFDLSAAKAGEKIVTREGNPVEFVAHIPEANEPNDRVIVFYDGDVLHYDENGVFDLCCESSDLDLFMAEKTIVMWVNFYEGGISEWFHDEWSADNTKYRSRIGGRAFKMEITV